MTEGTPQRFTDRKIKNIVDTTGNTRQESNPKPKENIGTKIKRLFAAGAAAATIATGAGSLAGCDQIPTAITDVQPSETKPSVTVTPTETTVKVTPTEAPTATPTPVETTVAPTETTISAEDLALLAEAGTLNGAETSIKVDANGNRVAVYVAKEGNDYGVKAGTELGQYCENVKYEGKDIKFRALIPVVVEKLLSDELAKIPDGQPKLKIIFPGNIIQANGNEINMTNLKDYFGNDTIQVSCTSSIDIVDIIPNSDAFSLSWFDWNNWTYAMPTYVGDQVKDLDNKTNNEIMYFVRVMIPETPKLNKETKGLNTKFGLIMGNSGGKDFFVACSDSKGSYPVKISDFANAEDDGYYMSIIPEEITETGN